MAKSLLLKVAIDIVDIPTTHICIIYIYDICMFLYICVRYYIYIYIYIYIMPNFHRFLFVYQRVMRVIAINKHEMPAENAATHATCPG